MGDTPQMNSRQRVQTTLRHQQPDRVPMMVSASRWVIDDLKQHVGVATDRQLHEALHLDVFDMRGFDYKGAVGPRFIGPAEVCIADAWRGNLFDLFGYQEQITENEYGKSYSMGEPVFSVEDYPTIEALETFRWPQAEWFDYSTLRPQLEAWADEYAIACTGCSVFQHPSLFRGIEQLLYELVAEPKTAALILDRVTDFYVDYFGRIFAEAGDLIDIFRLADDIGAQDSLLISPKILEEFVAPRVRKCTDLAHQYNIKVLFHTDGNVREAIPDIIEWGIDILDPIQPEVASMEARGLKREFGDKLSFSGGVGSQEILPHGSVEDVKAEVGRILEAMKPGGGYVLSPGHPSLQMDVPRENIVAMFEAGLKYGKYYTP